MKFKPILTLALITLISAQAPADAPKFIETTYIDTKDNVSVRKKQVNITFIPEGATDNTWVDFWMDGSYSTLIRSDKEIYWEVSMSLHVPTFVPGAFYTVWL